MDNINAADVILNAIFNKLSHGEAFLSAEDARTYQDLKSTVLEALEVTREEYYIWGDVQDWLRSYGVDE